MVLSCNWLHAWNSGEQAIKLHFFNYKRNCNLPGLKCEPGSKSPNTFLIVNIFDTKKKQFSKHFTTVRDTWRWKVSKVIKIRSEMSEDFFQYLSMSNWLNPDFIATRTILCCNLNCRDRWQFWLWSGWTTQIFCRVRVLQVCWIEQAFQWYMIAVYTCMCPFSAF